MGWPKFEIGLIIYCRHKNEWSVGQNTYRPRDVTIYEYILRILHMDSGHNGSLDLSTEILATTRPLNTPEFRDEVYFDNDKWFRNLFPRLFNGQNNSDLVIKKLNPKNIPLYLSWPYVSDELSNILREDP